MSDITQFSDEVLDKFSRHITGAVFLMIQNDRKFMQRYMELLKDNTPQAINSYIGKAVKTQFNLENQERNEEPISTLIKSHQEY